MPATPIQWSTDRRLDILVLGPMGDPDRPQSTVAIQDALHVLLREPATQALLVKHSVIAQKVHVPEGQTQPEIVHNILSLLDCADLVLFDLTPKRTQPDRANVFYELALVHALGIPALLVIEEGHQVPFYAQTMTQYRVPNFDTVTLAETLRAPLLEFLDWENRTSTFTNDRVSQFYGLPIVDISAAVGVATGYYYNFLSRLITEGGFLGHYPDKIKQVIYVRPSSVNSTYEADIAALKERLGGEGLDLTTGEKLAAIASDDKGPLWFDHVQGIVIDIPRTVYPLRRSPRLLSLQGRNPTFASLGAEKVFLQRLRQIEENLLARVEEAIRFQIRHDGPRVRAQILHFTTLENVAALVKSLIA